jgi:hypothetical protein
VRKVSLFIRTRNRSFQGENLMRFSTFMAIAALLALLFGLGFLLFPAELMSSYGVTLEEAGQWVGRYLGSAFMGISVLAWLARKAERGGALRAIVLGFLVLSAVSLVVAILDVIYGAGNALVWSTVVIHVFLTVGLGYFQFVKPAGS